MDRVALTRFAMYIVSSPLLEWRKRERQFNQQLLVQNMNML